MWRLIHKTLITRRSDNSPLLARVGQPQKGSYVTLQRRFVSLAGRSLPFADELRFKLSDSISCKKEVLGIWIEQSLHMQLRKVLKTRGHFPSDEAATKLIYLVVRDITKKWNKPPITWKLAATQFAIRLGQRFFAVEIWKTYSQKPKGHPGTPVKWPDSCSTTAPCQNKCRGLKSKVRGNAKQETMVVRRHRMCRSRTPTVYSSACAR
jgi:hypothetical protein